MPVVRLCWILLLALFAAGCASAPGGQAIEPDTTLLAPAEQALDEARSAHVEQFAPRALDSARRRLALARDIVYLAARRGRALDDDEYERVTNLVEAARLDARLALVKTQAMAVSLKLNELQRALDAQGAATDDQGAAAAGESS